MSFFPGKDPSPGDAASADAIDLVIVPRSVDLGGFEVRRALPHAKRRLVGPFVFFDHFGPAVFRAGAGVTAADKIVRGIAGALYGQRSPVKTLHDTIFADATLSAGAVLPIDADAEERAVYVIAGEIDIGGDRFGAGRLLVLRPGDRVPL